MVSLISVASLVSAPLILEVIDAFPHFPLSQAPFTRFSALQSPQLRTVSLSSIAD